MLGRGTIRRLMRSDVRADVDEELRFHLEARIADYEARGMTRDDAERAARERFGDADAVRHTLETHDRAEQRREYRREYMSDLVQDIRFAVRALRRTPGFTMTVLATLALGIGANTAVFAVVARQLLEPLPYRDAGRLVVLYTATARAANGRLSPAQVDRLQHNSRTLTRVAEFGDYGGITFAGDRETVTWRSASVGPAFFQALGVRPLLGRLIDGRDVAPGAQRTVVLGHDVWQRDFGADSGVVGRTIHVGELDLTVVGVLRPDFIAPARAPQVWMATDAHRMLATRMANSYWYQAVGRMTDDATPAQVAAELRVLAHGASPDSAATFPSTIVAVPIRDAIVGDTKAVLLAVMGAALVVLVLAGVNVTGLFLARATARRREIAVRAALGAGRWRIARQLVTESTLLGVAGGAAGLLLAVWGKQVLASAGGGVLAASGPPAAIGGRVLAFGALASVALGLAMGLIPAVFRGRDPVGAALGESSRGAAGGRRHALAGRALVTGQMALAVLLLVGAGLLGRTLVALEHTDMGYDASRDVLSVYVTLPASYASPESQAGFFTGWLDRVRAIPGVRAAGAINIAPWNGWNHAVVHVAGGDSVIVPLGQVTDGYFASVGTRVVAGRAFTATDRAGSLPVAVVSQQLARAAWPGGDAIGQHIRIQDDATWRTVVGVAADVRENPAARLEAAVYEPAWQSPQRWYEVLVRGDGDAMALLPAVRQSLRSIDPAIPAVGANTLDETRTASLARQRLPALFIGVFAGLALALAVLGMYGVIAYTVTLRTRELGIRAALGGSRSSILGLVVRDGLQMAVIGTVIGIGAAALGSRLLGALLYGVTAHDPLAFTGAAAVLLVASVAACLVPGRRAIRVAPVEALRTD